MWVGGECGTSWRNHIFWVFFTLKVVGFSWEFWECCWISKNCYSFYIWIEASCLLRCAGQSGKCPPCWSDLWNDCTEFCTWEQAAYQQFLTAPFMSCNMQGGKVVLGLVASFFLCPWHQYTWGHEICFQENRKKSVILPRLLGNKTREYNTLACRITLCLPKDPNWFV